MEGTKLYKNKYRIKSARYNGHDYSQAGYYFVTICTKNREMFFGNIIGQQKEAKMTLSEIGKMAVKYWLEIPKHFNNVILDEFVVMPNHLHGVIVIDYGNDGRDEAVPRFYAGEYPQMSKISPKPGSLPVIIGSFKSIVTKITNQKFPKNNFGWQTRFHDRVIRDEKELHNVRNYIYYNISKWYMDRNNSEGLFM